MTITLWLIGVGVVTLVVLVVLTVRTNILDKKVETEKEKRVIALAKDVEKATVNIEKATNDIGKVANDVGLIALVSRHVAEDCLKDNPVLREKLIISLEKAGAVCSDCPLRSSSLCEDCGREAIPTKELS